MRYALLIIIINIFSVVGAAAVVVPDALLLKSHVKICKDKLLMTDLIVGKTADVEFWNKLSNIVIIDDFKGRKNLRVSKASVWNKMRHFLLSDSIKLNIKNDANYITVARKPFVIKSEEIIKTAKYKLLQESQKHYQNVSLQLSEAVNDAEVYQRDFTLSASLVGVELIKRREKIWVTVKAHNRTLKRIPVWFNVSAKTQGWVLRHKIGKSTVFNPFMVESQLVEIGNYIGKPIRDLSVMPAMEFRYAVNAGRVLSHNMLRKLPAVKVGREVNVKSVYGAVSINTSGLALSSGEIGETVRIKSKSSDEEFKAYVIQPGMVQVKGGSL